MMPSGTSSLRAALTSRLSAGFFSTIEAVVARAFAIDAGPEDRLQLPLDQLGAGDERRDLLLLVHLPVDVGLDVGMVDVDDDHLGRAARRAARLDRAGRAVADLQERHQAGRAAAARQLLVLAAQGGEIGAGAGAVFEEARLAHPEVHDAALVDEVVGDRLDEAGVRLRMLIGRLRLRRACRSRNRRKNGPGSGRRRHRPSGGRC